MAVENYIEHQCEVILVEAMSSEASFEMIGEHSVEMPGDNTVEAISSEAMILSRGVLRTE